MALSTEEHARIAAAIAEAETRTSGEIFCVVAPETDEHRAVPFAWAALVSLILPPLLVWTGAVGPELFEGGGWQAGIAEGKADIGAVAALHALLSAALFALTFLVVSIPAVRRRLTPASLRRAAVHRSAVDSFLSHGIHVTDARTGVLIFLSTGDRMAEIVADKGIYRRVDAGVWGEAVSTLLDGVAAGRIADGFVASIEACGRVLAEHFPPRERNPNELPDKLVEL
jgi:putative membrane protein